MIFTIYSFHRTVAFANIKVTNLFRHSLFGMVSTILINFKFFITSDDIYLIHHQTITIVIHSIASIVQW